MTSRRSFVNLAAAANTHRHNLSYYQCAYVDIGLCGQTSGHSFAVVVYCSTAAFFLRAPQTTPPTFGHPQTNAPFVGPNVVRKCWSVGQWIGAVAITSCNANGKKTTLWNAHYPNKSSNQEKSFWQNRWNCVNFKINLLVVWNKKMV